MDTNTTQLPWRALGLYAATLALEWIVTCWRFFVILVATTILYFLTGGHVDLTSLVLFAYFPSMWSLIALSRTVGWIGTGQWWRTRVGGREPSTRERRLYDEAMLMLEERAPGQLRRPKDWFVVDLPEPEAAVCGQSLMLTRGMLDSPYLPAVLAHELGHLATWDARLAAAINRLIIHPMKEPRPDQERYERQAPIPLGNDPVSQTIIVVGIFSTIMRIALRWCRGGIGLWLLKPLWGRVWRESEYAADQYAAMLGQGHDLADFLQINALVFDQPVPFTWLSAHTHPPTELRIDRLTASANRSHDTHYMPSVTPLGRDAARV
jgi:Zn-dependent protease with chaperone function